MKRLIGAAAVCAVAIGVVAGSAGATATTKLVPTAVTLTASPTTITPTTTAVDVSGNVQAGSSCRKDRTVHLHYLTDGVMSAEVGSATTGPNGDFKVTVPPPPTTTAGTTQVHAVVDETIRTKVIKGKRKGAGKGKKKGAIKKRKFDCQEGTGVSNTLTITP